MKKILSVIALSLLCISSYSQGIFTLKIKTIEGLDISKIYISLSEGKKFKRDSITISKNEAIYKDSAIKMVRVNILSKKDGGEIRRFLAAPNEILTIEIGKKGITNAMVYGSEINEDYNKYVKQLESSNKEIDSLIKERKKVSKESEEFKKFENKFMVVINKQTDVAKNFIISNPDSKASLHIFSEKYSDQENAEEIYAMLTEKAKYDKELASSIERIIAREKLTRPGTMAPEIISMTADGKEIKLSSYRGKYVLVDFWASWCKPCRAENPNVLKAYNQFKDKNFDILAVSVDDDKEKWLKAVKDDALLWTHVSELKGWNIDAIKQYGVVGIPANFLIGPDGKIIAKNLRGNRLHETLKNVLK